MSTVSGVASGASGSVMYAELSWDTPNSQMAAQNYNDLDAFLANHTHVYGASYMSNLSHDEPQGQRHTLPYSRVSVFFRATSSVF